MNSVAYYDDFFKPSVSYPLTTSVFHTLRLGSDLLEHLADVRVLLERYDNAF